MFFQKSNEIKQLKAQIEQLNAMLSPEQQNVVALQNQIVTLTQKKDQLENEISKKSKEVADLHNDANRLTSQIIQLNDEILLQSFGLYEPKYDFVNSEQYKTRLDEIRSKQKEYIKSGIAVTGNVNWQINGSASKGRQMVKDTQKLLLRAFNSECDEAISKVKYSNYDTCVKRITASKDAISKLGKMLDIAISSDYYRLKIQELDLAFEYQQMKQKEKEEQRALKEQLREEAKLQKEIEDARKKIQKEQTHYMNALDKINKQLAQDPDNADLLAKKAEIETSIADAEKAMKDIDYREANKRAGYVYVISNIGAFGENVYKIGMTRRLDPQERVDELGDASVPFRFDVHAMIFSDDAPALEAALHRAFEHKRLNKVNLRREFFRVTLDEIKSVVQQNYEKTAEFIEFPEAEQFRISQKLD